VALCNYSAVYLVYNIKDIDLAYVKLQNTYLRRKYVNQKLKCTFPFLFHFRIACRQTVGSTHPHNHRWTISQGVNLPQRESDRSAPLMSRLRILVALLHFPVRLRQSVQRWATGWPIGVLGFDSLRSLGIFFFTTASRTALGPTQSSIQWVLGAISPGIKRPGCEADHSTPSSAEVKDACSYTSTPSIRLHGVVRS
jgi:hypothetical protein